MTFPHYAAGGGGACVVLAAETCGVSTMGYLPLAMAATLATEEEQAMFLSVRKKKKMLVRNV